LKLAAGVNDIKNDGSKMEAGVCVYCEKGRKQDGGEAQLKILEGVNNIKKDGGRCVYNIKKDDWRHMCIILKRMEAGVG